MIFIVPKRLGFLLLRYVLPAVLVAAALGATQSLKNPVFPTPLFFAAIVISTWFAGGIPGLIAVLLAALALDYYFIPPLRSLTWDKPEMLYLVEFVLPALVTCWFVKKRRITETFLRQSRDQLESRVQERTAELRQANDQLKGQIAERIRAEETVQRTQAELAHITRAMTVGELGASVAHEVNQPLMAVVINGDACLRWLAGTPPNLDQAREAVERIIQEGNRAGEIVRRIRDLSKKGTPHRSPVDLNQLIREALALTRRETLRQDVTSKVELAKSLPPVMGDRVQLQQVILNLVMNAVEAMSDRAGHPRELTIRSATENGSVSVTVEDSGPGLPVDDAERMFTAFFTTKPQGLGMGLSISRTIIEAHGGRLWAVNGSQGATFQFRVPSHEEKV